MKHNIFNFEFNDAFIREVKTFLTSGSLVFPPRVHYPSEKAAFRAQLQGFAMVGDNLHYMGAGGTPKQIISQGDVGAVLTKLYSDLGDIGRDRLYAIVKSKYLGISRRRVQQFLNQQEL